MVDVSSQSNKVNITVSSSGVSSNVNASGDTTLYYSNKAREWAISNRIVDGVDYSSKYYAEKSNQSALNAQSFAQSAQDSYNNFQQSVDVALSNIDSSVQGAIEDINNTKTDIITDIEFVAEGEKKEIEDLIDSGKDELKESIGDVKVLTTLEIGDIGFTQMAIDESKGKRRILNGQLIIQDQYVQFTNIIKNSVALNPDLACTEAEWQTELTMSANGVCYKYVIDDEAGTIRLPKYPEYLDLSINTSAVSQTVSVYGNGKVLGLYGNKEGGLGSASNGSVYARVEFGGTNAGTTISGATAIVPGNNNSIGVTTNASKSGLTGKVTVPAVQSEKIKGTYFIQVATGAETEDNIINEIELNNPFSLLDYKYSEYELNNLSWLRSEGQWNSKAVYTAVYDLLLKIYNGTETKAGVSVKLTTETFTDYDFVLNTADETFRLPIKVKQKFFNSGDVPVAGNGKTLGLTNGTTNAGLIVGTSAGLGTRSGNYGSSVGRDWSGSEFSSNKTIGVTTDPAKSGLVAKLSSTEVSGLYLYFYVGETVQNANLVNIGRIQEQYTTKSMVDGQVEVVNQTLASNVSLSNTIHTYDLSGYIPSDGYNYEIQVGITGATSATSGAGMEIRMGTDISPLGCGFVGANTPRTNATVQVAGNINLVVGMERKLYLQNSSSTSSFSLTYLRLGTRRRLGTNL